MRAGETSRNERRTLMVDGVVAALLLAFMIVGTYFASLNQPGRRPFDAGAVVLLIVAAGALTVRRLHPVAVLLIVFLATGAYLAIGYANGPIWLPLIVAFLTVVIRGHRWVAVTIAAIGLLAFTWMDTVLRDAPPPTALGVAALAAWLLVLLGAGEAFRIRNERAAEAIAMREEEALRRAGEERLRIARELHDALGHHLSLISVQSGVALHLSDALPEQARASLEAINSASKEGLSELRSVLEILRQRGEPAPRAPSSPLAGIDDLVTRSSAAGLEVNVETVGEVRPLPFGVERAAFRIVQEALTNAARHAAPATVDVRLEYGDGRLGISVEDDGRGGVPVRSGGKGIVGMRERASALGGELEAGPGPGGGFRVKATLPAEGQP